VKAINKMNITKIQDQLDSQRRSVAFDSYDITVRQLYDMIIDEIIDVAPEYQRHFIWDEIRQSQLIESVFLGIPIPSLFMATNKDSTWEVIDGLQRLTTIVNYLGNEKTIKRMNSEGQKLKIQGLEKLDALNGLLFEDLPKTLQTSFLTRPIRVTVLNDRSDFNVRYDLFERLNTGGVTLHPQEIRNCIFIGDFNTFIKDCAENPHFKRVIKLTEKAKRTGNLEELVLRFFAYFEYRDKFVHGVNEFLNRYMEGKTISFKNKTELRELFKKTFEILDQKLPDGIVRGKRKNITPIVLYEAISVGVAHHVQNGHSIDASKIRPLLNDKTLNRLTTGATNSKNKLFERIELVISTLS
jgi:hypothetical protein